MKGRAEDHTGTLLENVQRMGSEAAELAKDRFDDLRETTSDYIGRGRKRASQLERDFEHRVQERPIVSLIAAVGCGFLIGFLYTRR